MSKLTCFRSKYVFCPDLLVWYVVTSVLPFSGMSVQAICCWTFCKNEILILDFLRFWPSLSHLTFDFWKTAHQSAQCDTSVCGENLSIQVSEVFGGEVWIPSVWCVMRRWKYSVACSFPADQLKQIPPHCLEGLRGVYSQLEVFTCSKSLNTLEVPFVCSAVV